MRRVTHLVQVSVIPTSMVYVTVVGLDTRSSGAGISSTRTTISISRSGISTSRSSTLTFDGGILTFGQDMPSFDAGISSLEGVYPLCKLEQTLEKCTMCLVRLPEEGRGPRSIGDLWTLETGGGVCESCLYHLASLASPSSIQSHSSQNSSESCCNKRHTSLSP